MASQQEIVITGVGVVSPIGIGKQSFAAALAAGRGAIRRLSLFDNNQLPVPFGAEVVDFDPKLYVRPRKSLKVMSRDIQFAFAAADLACGDASVREQAVDPERLGIVFGSDLIAGELHDMEAAYRGCLVDGKFDFNRWGETAMAEIFPLWMLKYLPNMPACHIGIAQDARGPNNSLIHGDVSSLSAVAEAMRVIERGHADVMIAGGTGSRIHLAVLFRAGAFDPVRCSGDPAAACRPFDAHRRGVVLGEGAGAFILESRRHAEARGARILARVLGYAATFEPSHNGRPLEGRAIRKAITTALDNAQVAPGEVGHVNANGLSTIRDDQIEAQAIRDTLGDVPVTAPKSFFGNLGAGTGAVEMAVSVLAFEQGFVPPTLNYQEPDPQCPVNVVRCQPVKTDKPVAVVLNHAQFGQAIAVVLAAPH
jgi:3-oxoacyl-[acyl-carrier-protein] synthase II